MIVRDAEPLDLFGPRTAPYEIERALAALPTAMAQRDRRRLRVLLALTEVALNAETTTIDERGYGWVDRAQLEIALIRFESPGCVCSPAVDDLIALGVEHRLLILRTVAGRERVAFSAIPAAAQLPRRRTLA